MEYRVVAKDGATRWVLDQATLVHLGDEAPYWQGFMMDITDRKEAEEQLAHALEVEREATHQLRALDEMKNTFLQAVSHDLRTPLAAILGLAITLERGEVKLDPQDARDLARRIADNARKLDRLVTNLLDMDRLARGIVTPKLQSTDVGALVRRLLAESELIGGARLHLDIQPVVIAVDAAKVERIVENLLANTARHTPSNAQIWVAVHPSEGGALLVVEDDGPGVAEELRETIFEPFQQGPEAPQHSPGVGVGLTLVKRFAELHGGRAWVQERSGGGASFRVYLPDGGAPAAGGDGGVR
jgi:signal transduction histidine kinase